MDSPFGPRWRGLGTRRSPGRAARPAAAILLGLTALLPAVPGNDAPAVLPDRAGDAAEALPPLDLPFLAVPFQSGGIASGREPAANFVLPPAEGFLPARAVVVPVWRCRGFEFQGNTVFGNDKLAECLSGFIGRDLEREDLDRIGYEITRRYVSGGYINSGATLPDPEAGDGILRVQVTEGRLTDVIATGNTALSDSYLGSRILRDERKPLHFPTLQERLQVLQQNGNIVRLNAELKPGLVPGEALMVIEVAEAPKWSYGMDFHNQRSPSVGGEQAELWFENRNLSGVSDLVRGRLGLFSGSPDDLDFAGLDNLALQYQRPVLADDTTVMLGWASEDYSILEEPFRSLAIDGESFSALAGLRRPLFRSLQDDVWLSLWLERSHDETTVLGRPFNISPGSVDGELDLTQIRCGVEWTRRSGSSAFSLRSVVSAGIDALGATDQPAEPDGEYFTWFTESQFIRRIGTRGNLLVFHGGLGLSDDPLPPPAQFRLGGRHTVRGYRENFVVRDNGACAGMDLRIPCYGDDASDGWNVWLVPFIDGGGGWNDGESSGESLLAAGLGIVADYGGWFRGELFYGVPLVNDDDGADDLQDEGIHFRLTVARF